MIIAFLFTFSLTLAAIAVVCALNFVILPYIYFIYVVICDMLMF